MRTLKLKLYQAGIYLVFPFALINLFIATAQTPQSISYQAVARDSTGLFIAEQTISLRFSIHDSIAAGTIIYKETQSVMTNKLGLFNVNIGQGTVVTGIFSNINWGNNAKFMQVEMDASGGSTYVNMGTQQMLSVPYALYSSHSGNAWNLSGNGGTTPGTNFIGTTNSTDLVIKTDNTERMHFSGSTYQIGMGRLDPIYALDITVNPDATIPCSKRNGIRINHPTLPNACRNGLFWGMEDDDYRKGLLWNYGNNASNAEYLRLGLNSDTTGEVIRIIPDAVGINYPSYTNAVLTLTERTATKLNGMMVTHVANPPGTPGTLFGLDNNGIADDALIWNYRNNAIQFGTNNLARMRISGDGNVGIGTLTPLEKLHVVGNIMTSSLAGAGLRMVQADANGKLVSLAPGTAAQVLLGNGVWGNISTFSLWSTYGNSGTVPAINFIGTIDSVDWVVRTNDQERVRVSAHNGNVGIGTSAPLNKLEINGNVYSNGIIGAENAFWCPASTASNPAYTTTGFNTGIFFPSAGSMGFSMSGSEVARFNVSGNLGIGTIIPSEKLHVIGNAKLTGSVNAGLNFISGFSSSAFPALTNNGLNAAGIFFPSINEIGFSQFNVETARFDGFGNFNLNNRIKISGGSPGMGKVLTSDLLGLATWEMPVSPWALTGNSGTIAGTNFIGTADPVDLVFKTDNSERLRILSDGRIGIGTSSPTYKLDVIGDVQIGSPSIWASSAQDRKMNFGDQNFVYIGEIGADDRMELRAATFYFKAGLVGIGTNTPSTNLHVIGSGLFTGTVTAACGVLTCSDLRYKKSITPLKNVLSDLKQLNGIRYYWKKEEFPDMNFTNDEQIGIIAQELEKVFPELVKTNVDGYKTVDYSRLTPVLLEAIKELNIKLEKIEQDNRNLKMVLENVQSKIQSSESKVDLLVNSSANENNK